MGLRRATPEECAQYVAFTKRAMARTDSPEAELEAWREASYQWQVSVEDDGLLWIDDPLMDQPVKVVDNGAGRPALDRGVRH